MVWGTIIEFDERRVKVSEISPLGGFDGENTYRLSSISYWDDDPDYAARLIKLGDFSPTKPEELSYITNRKEVRRILVEAAETGEVCRVRLRSEESTRTIKVEFCDKDWAGFRVYYDDLMQKSFHMTWRVSTVERIRWRTASEESDEFLIRLAQ